MSTNLLDVTRRTIEEIDMPFGCYRITGSVSVELEVQPYRCTAPYGCGEIIGSRVVDHDLYIGSLDDEPLEGLLLPPWEDIEPTLRKAIEEKYVNRLEAE